MSTILWRPNPKPAEADFYYQFSLFTLQLNHLSESLRERLPPTDARFRPDQRAMEDGDLERAAREKERLEEAQRARRKEIEDNGTEYVPKYFDKVAEIEW